MTGMSDLHDVMNRWADLPAGSDTFDGMYLRQLGELHKTMVAALDEVREALAPRMVEARADGYTWQLIAELAGYSIQGVRRIIDPNVRDYNSKLGRETSRLAREARNASRR